MCGTNCRSEMLVSETPPWNMPTMQYIIEFPILVYTASHPM
jgi:hypothetical protein